MKRNGLVKESVLAGVREGVRDLDQRFAKIRRSAGVVPVNFYTFMNAALGDDGASRRLREAARTLPSRLNLKALQPVRPATIAKAARGDRVAGEIMRYGARKATIYLGTRPKVLRALVPG